MGSSSEQRHEQESTTLSGGAGVVELDSSRDEGPAEPLLLTPWVQQSAAEGATQGPHSVMQGVRGVVHDGCQLS